MIKKKPDEQLTPLQNAFFLMRQAQGELTAYKRAQSEPIAVIGMGCRFPGADDIAGFWRLLRSGTDAVCEVPSERWNIDDYYDADPAAPGKMNTRRGGFIDNVDQFDAEFFDISPREAVRIDPQQRLLLEVTWKAIEDAGLPADRLAQTRTGVYVGVLGFDYAVLQSHDLHDMDIFSASGNSHAIMANRLSYFLNLCGPSLALDTACSSSLVTVHLACQSLRRRESDLALAGGVNLMLSPAATLMLTKARMMADDGRCKVFDAEADGYVRGEGCGMVVLKRLSEALVDGDRITAVIRGSAVNHVGRSNGLSAPNGLAQEEVIRAALDDSRLRSDNIDYVEAHGTGTRLGDPIEIEALQSVLGVGRSVEHPLRVGSVKTNIGHLESAAGIAGLIKVALMLRHEQIPPHLNLNTVNPLLGLENTHVEIPTVLQDWPRGTELRRAGVSAFAFGGTNAHVILEEPPHKGPAHMDSTGTDSASQTQRTRHIWTLSARSVEALGELAGRYAAALQGKPDHGLADWAYTANTGRMHFTHRAAIVADSVPTARKKLQQLVSEPLPGGVRRGLADHSRPPRVAFLFTGQGAQYTGMGRVLYETQPSFRATMDRCAECLDGLLDLPLRTLLDPQAGSLLNQTGYTQPVMFALEYALATLWRSWGVEPVAVMGHSVGEFAAACIAGVYKLEDALRLIAERARLMQALPSGGAMAAVFASPEQVTRVLHDSAEEIGIAAYNGPRNVVVSGTSRAVRRLLGTFNVEGIHSKTLVTSHAFHSHMMDPMLQPLEDFADSLSSRPPQIQLISNLTGQPAEDRTYADPGYWARHARSPVQFAAGMQTLAECGCDVFLEIGPSPILVGMGQRCLPGDFLRWLPSLRSGRDDWQTLLESLAELYVTGTPVDWTAFDRDYRRQRRELPSYPFQRKRYWAKSAEEKLRGGGTRSHIGPSLHPFLGRRIAAAVAEQVFESQITASRPLILADHKIQGVVVMPGAAYLEMALAASTAVYGRAWDVCETTLVEPLLLDQRPTTVQTIIAPQGEDAASFRIVSLNEDEPDQESSYKTHAVGRLDKPSEATVAPLDIDAQRARFTGTPFDDEWRTEALRKSGLQPGPSFCWILFHWLNEQDALGQVRETRSNDHDAGYLVHPGLLDCAFQLLGAVLPGAGTGIDAYVPMTVERLRLLDRTGGPAWYLVSLTSVERDLATGDVILVDGEGRVLMMVEGLRLQRVPRDWLARLVAEPRQELTYELVWQEHPAKIDTDDESSRDTEIKRTSQPASEPAIWLVFDSQDGLGTALARRLELKSHSCRVVTAHDAGSRRTFVREFLSNNSAPVGGIVYLSALDIDGLTDGTAPDFDTARDSGWGGALDVLQAIVETHTQRPPRLWLVTRGAQPVGETDHGLALAQSPLWGLGRVIASEHPELTCTRIDLDYRPRAEEADQLADEICGTDREDQVAFREGRRWVSRLHPAQNRKGDELKVPHGQPYRLEIIARGQLDQVELRPISRLSLEPGQVEIEVRATGLNFRDVLNVLNLYPGDPGPLGGECAGEVVTVGAGVEHVKPGDQVVALAPASFASHVITLDKFVVAKPAGLSFQEAATIPIAFLSAYFGLCRLGRMNAQDRVLIHAASGGVGLAAIQLAQQAGAEIFATAGNPRKREYLKLMGIQHVMDSRSLDFAEQIRQVTKGEGVDLVLNSLTGETIASSLSVLRSGGRFLELGKTDLWDQTRVDEFRPGVAFHAIALDQMMAEQAETVHELMQEVMPQFAEGRLEPLPLRTFSISRMVNGLRHMARAEHIGKVVIEAERVEETSRIFRLRKGGAYLVTGGLGGLGLKVAGWLTAHGARHLVLAGRSVPSEEAQAALTEIEQAGAQVTVRCCDVADRYEVAELLTAIAEELPPLRGIFHLAGILDDGVLREQTRERFDRVMAAKVLGAWNLHELTENLSLDQFVLFSSAASLMGSPGQGNYAAANAFLDALAHHRRAESRPALSVNWGMWSDVGMAARLQDERAKRWLQSGVGSIEPELGLQTLEQLLTEDAAQVGVLPIDWTKFFDLIPPGTEPAWLSDLARSSRAVDGAQRSGSPVLLEKLKTVTPGERFDLATTFLQQQAARVLAIDEDHLPDPRRKLNELGFDSLTGVELVNSISQAIGQEINPALLFDYPTLESLAFYIIRDALHLASEAETPADEPIETEDVSREQLAEDVKGMSEEEMNALVSKQLGLLQAGED